jgi:hypothetical protein
MNAIDTLPETQTRVEAVLTDLDSVATAIKDSYSRLKAIQVGSITLPGQNELGLLRSEGRRNAGSLAAILGVEVRHDVFSSGRNALLGGRTNVLLQG